MPFPNAGGVNLSTNDGTDDYMVAKMATQQTTNVGAGDHLKLDTVVFSSGNSIRLDNTSGYATTLGVTALGRLLLRGGRNYYLRAVLPYFLGSGATGLVDLQFYDVTNNVALAGTLLTATVSTDASNDTGGGDASAWVAPGNDIIVELRIITATAVTQFGTTAGRHPLVWVETL